MKYAIISDMHGNAPALKAVLADAEANGAEQYLLLGDYTTNFPWGNEVVELIRGLKNAVIIRGNGEGYLTDVLKNGQSNHAQFKPIYWAYNSLSKDNLAYLEALPETADFQDNGETIYLSHAMDLFMRREERFRFFYSEEFRTFMKKRHITHEQYLTLARDEVLACPAAAAEIGALPKGLYLFGHNHLQFYMEHNGRLFINPGSCGEALDWDTTAPYTLLERKGDGWLVTERRVNYDLQEVAKGLRTSGYAAYAPEWSRVIELELLSGKDYFFSFVSHIIKTGRELGQNEYPVSDQTFRAAVATWVP